MSARTQLGPPATAGRRYRWLHDLGNVAPPIAGFGRVAARQARLDGADAGDVFLSGAARRQSYSAGSIAGEVEC